MTTPEKEVRRLRRILLKIRPLVTDSTVKKGSQNVKARVLALVEEGLEER